MMVETVSIILYILPVLICVIILKEMKKLLFLSILTFVALLFPTSAAFAQTSVTDKRIVIDAGHGGSDSGAVNTGLKESDVTRDIANRLKIRLEADGAIVGLTRDCDCDKSNNDRYTFANNFNGDVLVSIHLNGSTNPSKDGTQGLYGQKTKDLDFAKVMHQALYPSLNTVSNFTDLGVTNFASGVLLKSNMPATIAETVFISNSNEYTLLTDGTGNRQQQIAQSLYQGLVNWFSIPPAPPKGGKH